MADEQYEVSYRLPDGSLQPLQDLPWEQVAKIEKAHGTSWVQLMDAPYSNGSAFIDLARLAHRIHDFPEPVIRTPRDAAALTSRLVLVDSETGDPVELEHQEEPDVAELIDAEPDGSLDDWTPTLV